MYSIIPFVLIILSLAVIIFIIIKKFPQLTLLDVASIPEVKTEQKKAEFYKKRNEEKARIASEKTRSLFQPLFQKFKNWQLVFRQYVGKIERQVAKSAEMKKAQEPTLDPETIKQDLKIILQEGDYALEQNDLDTAEKKFISAIRLDAKNIEAYYGLGSVYQSQGQMEEAIQTFQFILQLDPQNVKTLVKLAEIEEGKNNFEKAVEYYQDSLLIDDNNPIRFAKIADLLQTLGKNETALEAIAQSVELEPQNPKYLDKMIEISVLCGNKKAAENAYNKLRMANPENQKLGVLKEKIDNLN